MTPINGHPHPHPQDQIELTEEIEIVQSQRETLWHAKTEDQPPTEFFIVDDSPDGLSLIVQEDDCEMGVTLAKDDVAAVIDSLVTWHVAQSMKLPVSESITGPRELDDSADTDD